jgi:hypothetical protein
MADFPEGRLAFKCEMGFGIEPGGAFINPDSWTDVTPFFLDQTVTITRGRANETDETQLMSMGFELDNSSTEFFGFADGMFTPDNAESILYPDVKRGVLCRYGIYGGQRFLQNPDIGTGNDYYRTPDNAALDVVGDIDIAFEIQPYGILEGTCVASKWTSAGNQRSWQLLLQSDPDHPSSYRVTFQWTTLGTVVSGQSVSSAYTFSYENKQNIRVVLDVSNAGNHVVNMYTATKWGEDWKLFYTSTIAGVTSIFNSTARLVVGADPEYGFYPFIGKLFKLQVKNGIAGTLVANPDFTIQDVHPAGGGAGFTDSAGRVWTPNGSVEISNLHTRFFGQVDSWEVTWPYGDTTGDTPPESRVVCQASSIRRKLGQGDQPILSAMRRQLSSEISVPVVAYWPIEDEEGAVRAASGMPNMPSARADGFNFGANSEFAGTAPLADLETLAYFAGTVPTYTSADFHTTGMMTFIPTTPAIDQMLFRVKMTTGAGATIYQVVLGINATNVTLQAFDLDGTMLFNGAGAHADAFEGVWGTWLLSISKDGTGVDFDVFFRPAGASAVTINQHYDLAANTISNARYIQSEFGSQLGGMVVGHISVVVADSADAYVGADDGWAGEEAINRFRRLSDEQGIAVGAGEVPNESTPLGPQGIDTFLSLMSETAVSSNSIFLDGRFFNGLQYIPLYDLVNQSVQIALDAAEEHITNPLSPTLDDQFIRNQIESSRKGGSSVVRQDDESVESEGLYPDQVTVNLESDDQLEDDANWRLHLGTVKGMAYPPITVELAKAPDLIPVWLDEYSDVSCVVTLANLPRQANPTMQRLILQGYVETISPTRWTLVFNCTPYQPYEVTQFSNDYAILRLDAEYSYLTDDYDENDTALVVSTFMSPWTTDPTDRPFDIVIGGEQMTVTGVSGAGGIQTLTVTRSINGVVKGHFGGDLVSLAYPVVLSLV